MKKDLLDILKIEKNNIITITGTGGKTSLMFYLGKLLKEKGSVLITTSTKIGYPKKDEVDFLFTSHLEYVNENFDKKIICIGEKIENMEKLSSLQEEDLKIISKDFDYVLIEGDGSRNLPIKMWKDHEPVIFSISNKVIGVMPIKNFGEKISPDFIYNFEGFKDHIDSQILNEEVYAELINYEKGLFKAFQGEKIVFLNQSDSEIDKENAKKVYKLLSKTKDKKLVYGSIKREEFYEY